MVWGTPYVGQGVRPRMLLANLMLRLGLRLNRQISNGVVTCVHRTNVVNQTISTKLSWISISFWWCSEEFHLSTCANKYTSHQLEVVIRTVFVFYTARGLGWPAEPIAQNWVQIKIQFLSVSLRINRKHNASLSQNLKYNRTPTSAGKVQGTHICGCKLGEWVPGNSDRFDQRLGHTYGFNGSVPVWSEEK